MIYCIFCTLNRGFFLWFQLILNAKCHAIRDAQLIEKVEIKKELLQEDKRLDEMMEVERLKALQEYEEREKQKQQERLEGAKVLREQIKDNVQYRMLEEERKDQETAVSVSGWIWLWISKTRRQEYFRSFFIVYFLILFALRIITFIMFGHPVVTLVVMETVSVLCFFVHQAMLQYLDKLQVEDMENLIKKKEVQKSLMKEVAKANEVSNTFKIPPLLAIIAVETGNYARQIARQIVHLEVVKRKRLTTDIPFPNET